ncbi:hypothetical protein AX17_001210 [Amanita inopinata Kibby_2008]|nr:hypothetical protein AX17_001210 [Amanita inopinata Kibby_2008]
MASITFPTEHGSSQASNGHGSHFYPPSFDTSSSFQMNPLSSHPPRTQSISTLPTSPLSYNDLDEVGGEETEGNVIPEDVELDEQQDKVKNLEGRMRKEDVWREIFLTSNGRDKAFKIMQYSIRIYLLLHTSVTASRLLSRRVRPPWEVDIVNRLQSTASGLSFTRKLLLLFNWLTPLTTIMAQQAVPFSTELHSEVSKTKSRPFLHSLLHASPPVLLEFVHAIADDAVIYSKLGLFGKRFGERAERFSDWCWLLSTLVGLVENGVERQMIGRLQSEVESRLYAESMSGATAKSNPRITRIDEKESKRLQYQDYWLQITRAKLLMDLIFVSYDLFKIRRARDSMKTVVGLAAAILSSAKLYDRHKTLLLKKMITS